MARKRQHSELPSRETLLEFIRDSEKAVARREIARAFNITADDRRHLSTMLNELEDEGAIGRGGGRRYSTGSGVPSVSVLDITGIDSDGEPECQLLKPPPGPAPKIRLVIGKGRGRPPGIGDRLLVRLDAQGANRYTARVIRRLPPRPLRIFGVIRKYGDRTMVEPTDRRLKTSYLIHASHKDGFRDGDMVACETTAERDKGLPVAKVTERIGSVDDPASVAALMIARHEIPDEFSIDALADAKAAGPAPMDQRFDLRDVPLVTIDDEDARDFDDAVWAAPDEADDNKGGWRLIVAIADVAWYVQPGSALDIVAAARGNSTYLPGKVVPMLPEALSNGWCSLNPNEDRPCLAVEIRIDAKGVKLEHHFHRAMMRSASRLTYNRVQTWRDDGINPPGAELPPGLLDALYGAFGALNKARIDRGTLDLELPERRIVFDGKGGIDRIEKRTRHDSHKLIEEFMIQANVCAAETLEAKKQPCMYRIHDDPEPDRVVALRQYLRSLGYSLAGGQAVRPRHFQALLGKMKGKPEAGGLQDAILRCQAKAIYSPENQGHFGLALRRYAHFTSPIRRYSDLMVHRALITGSGLGPGGLGNIEPKEFEQVAAHISMTERRAVSAERDAFDRLAALYLAKDPKGEFAARITGVERFGLFVELDDTGANGLLPISALGDEYFRFEAAEMALIGDGSGEKFSLGDRLQVRLAEISTETGSISLTLTDREPRANDGRRRGTGGRYGARRGGGKKGSNKKRGQKSRSKRH